MSSTSLPTVDISCYFHGVAPEETTFPSQAQKKVSAELDHAFRTIGLVLLKGIPLDPNLLNDMSKCAKEMFDKPAAQKKGELSQFNLSSFFGYSEFAKEAVNPKRKPDLKEVSNATRNAQYAST